MMIKPAAFVLIMTLQAASASTITITPHAVGEISLDNLHGSLRRLAWSPDGKQLYLQTFDQNKDASPKQLYHYLLSTADAKVKKLDAEPDWAETYWAWKSAQASADNTAFAIELITERKRATAVATPMGGDYARGGSGSDISGGAGGASMSDMAAAANQQQLNDVRTLKLKGEVIAEYVNLPIAPGQTFGWAPKGSGALIAYADKNNGKLTVMDATGAKKKFDDTSRVALPSWSADGAQIAWLEGKGKKDYVVVIGEVKR
jgi:hypothetical protein